MIGRFRQTYMLTITVLLCSGTVRADDSARPDIVVFLADDLGWADCPLYGGKEVAMPNLIRLAKEGMTFTHAFVVSPSRRPTAAIIGVRGSSDGARYERIPIL